MTRDRFVEQFGEDEALKLEAAANEHRDGANDKNRGSDPFKWVLLICIGYDCMAVPSFRKHHNITTSWKELRQWIINNAELGSHDGDYDGLSALSGAYNEFVKKSEVNPAR